MQSTTPAQEFLEELLAASGDVGPKVDQFTEEMAEQRLRFEIGQISGDKQQAGLWSIHKVLLEHGVPPGVRLHLVSAVVNLSLLAAERRSKARPAALGR